jgi:subtilisin family serine protease
MMRWKLLFLLVLMACTDSSKVALQLLGVTPRVAAAGETVILRGAGFTAGSTVKIGNITASIISSNAVEIQVVMPSLPIGEYNVLLREPDGTALIAPGPAVLGSDDLDVMAREVLVKGTFSQQEALEIASQNGFDLTQFQTTISTVLPTCNQHYAVFRDTRGRSTAMALNELQVALQRINPSYEANPRSLLTGSQIATNAIPTPLPIPTLDDPNLANVKVAVLDSGVSSHPSLLATLGTGENLTNYDNPSDPRALKSDVSDLGLYGANIMGHGTGVAALISGSSLGLSRGYAVGAPILPFKVCQTNAGKNRCDGSDVVYGICQAVASGAKVINLSLSGKQPFRALKQVLLETSAQNISIVAAAGNDGATANPPANYPAAYALEIPGLIAVAASENNGTNWLGSGYSTPGDWVSLSAPGANETAVVTDNGVAGYGLATLEGTSFATPIVSAAVARLIAKNPSWTPAQIKTRLENTAQVISCSRIKCGAGLLDINAAILP